VSKNLLELLWCPLFFHSHWIKRCNLPIMRFLRLSNACKGDLFSHAHNIIHTQNKYAYSGPQKPTQCMYIAAIKTCSEGGVLNAFAARLNRAVYASGRPLYSQAMSFEGQKNPLEPPLPTGLEPQVMETLISHRNIAIKVVNTYVQLLHPKLWGKNMMMYLFLMGWPSHN